MNDALRKTNKENAIFNSALTIGVLLLAVAAMDKYHIEIRAVTEL